MWSDWAKGSKMELEVILGNPIRLAREKGFDMPRMQTMYALIKKAQENRDVKRESKL
jgi:ketopantoate reductase